MADDVKIKLRRGDLLVEKLPNSFVIYEFIRRLAGGGKIHFEQIDTRHPRIFSDVEIATKVVDGVICIDRGDEGLTPVKNELRDFESLPEDMKIEARRRLTYLKRLAERGLYKLRKAETKLAITEIATELEDSNPPSYATLQRWKKKAGPKLDIRKLVDRIHLKGNREPRLDPEVEDRIDEVIEDKFLTTDRWSIADTYSHLCDQIRDDNALREKRYRLELPSYWSLWNRIQKIDRYEYVLRRHNKAAAEAQYSAVGAGPIATRPLELVEIDHTKLDIFVIDEESGLPIGRPWIVVMIDRATRMPVGVHISFDPPSVQTVAQCLHNAVRPKTYVADLYPELNGDWPAFGLPYELHFDRAMENLGHDLEDICASLGIHMRFSPRKRPWFKGVIERYFRTLNEGLIHNLRGTTFSNFLMKGEYDSKKNAILDIKQLHHVVHKWIIDIYIRRKHRGIKNTPYSAWVEGVKEHEINQIDDIETLKAYLGCVDRRVLSRGGVDFEYLDYMSASIVHWLRDPEFIKRSEATKTGYFVKIKYDSTDIGKIWVFDPRCEKYFEMPCTSPEYATGLSLWQHKRHCQYVSNELKKKVDIAQLDRAKVELAQMVDDILQGFKGNRKTKSAQGAARQKGIGKVAAAGSDPGSFGADVPKPRQKITAKKAVKKPQKAAPEGLTPVVATKKRLEDAKELFTQLPSDSLDF